MLHLCKILDPFSCLNRSIYSIMSHVRNYMLFKAVDMMDLLFSPCHLQIRKVYMEWMEATVLSIYLPEEKRTFICTFDLSFCLRLPCCLRPPFPGTCPAEPSATSV